MVQRHAGAFPCARAFWEAMSKYATLSAHLRAHPGDEWRASFTELEEVLGFGLPKAARAGRHWWSNDPAKRHSRAWVEHGWRVGDVDHAAGHVIFRRSPASPREVQPPAMHAAAESASARMHAARAASRTALVTAGAAVVGLGVLAVRALMRRSR